MLVTPERAVTPAFAKFLNAKRSLQELDRIVINECHIMLESITAWRPALLDLITMTSIDTQVVYLTATLPPTLQRRFMQLAGLDISTLAVCQSSTTQKQISYLLAVVEAEAIDSKLVELSVSLRRMLGEEAQIIVYSAGKVEEVE